MLLWGTFNFQTRAQIHLITKPIAITITPVVLKLLQASESIIKTDFCSSEKEEA
jgi:hypothetical protein